MTLPSQSALADIARFVLGLTVNVDFHHNVVTDGHSEENARRKADTEELRVVSYRLHTVNRTLVEESFCKKKKKTKHIKNKK